MERDIREDKEIKEYQLQEELRILPTLVWYYNEQYQTAKNKAQELKAKYEYIQQDAFLNILAIKTEQEGKKPTDKVISANVSLDEDVKNAYNLYLEAERMKNRLYTCVEVIECKISAIKQLVELRKIDYYNTDMSVQTEALAENKTKSNILRQKGK